MHFVFWLVRWQFESILFTSSKLLWPLCRLHGTDESTCNKLGHSWAGPSLMMIGMGFVYSLFSMLDLLTVWIGITAKIILQNNIFRFVFILNNFEPFLNIYIYIFFIYFAHQGSGQIVNFCKMMLKADEEKWIGTYKYKFCLFCSEWAFWGWLLMTASIGPRTFKAGRYRLSEKIITRKSLIFCLLYSCLINY